MRLKQNADAAKTPAVVTIISDKQAKYSRTIDVLDALAVAKIDNVTSTSSTAATAGCSNLLRRTRSGNSHGLIALTTTADVKIGRERPPRSPLAARSHVVVLWTFT